MKNPGLKILLTLCFFAAVLVLGLSFYRNYSPSGISVYPLPPSPRLEESGRLNINTASLRELQALPGIGPELAQRIIDYRNTNGPFTHIAQLTFVPGIGASKLEQILDHITVTEEETP